MLAALVLREDARWAPGNDAINMRVNLIGQPADAARTDLHARRKPTDRFKPIKLPAPNGDTARAKLGKGENSVHCDRLCVSIDDATMRHATRRRIMLFWGVVWGEIAPEDIVQTGEFGPTNWARREAFLCDPV